LVSNLSQLQYPKEDLIALLHLSLLYQAPAGLEWAKRQIWRRNWDWHPTELISLALEFRAPQFFESGFRSLVRLSHKELTAAQLVGLNVTVLLACLKVQESLRDHRHIIAAEPPLIDEHDPACINNQICATDWHAAWWNGIARFLLDGRYPLEWDDAFRLFERMEFGHMHPACTKKMLVMVKEGDALVLPEVRLINKVTEQLISTLLPNPLVV
jgi:hypothetical protein